jgi:hypothetical protein
MALTFPSSPTPGQVYQEWTWDGQKWVCSAATPVVGRNYVWADMNGSPLGGLANNTFNKVPFSRKLADPDGVFDAVTNHRYQPNVAGKFLICGSIGMGAGGGSTLYEAQAQIYKNGSAIAGGADGEHNANPGYDNWISSYSAIVQMNGTTDYIEMYAFINQFGTFTNNINGSVLNTFFNAVCFAP